MQNAFEIELMEKKGMGHEEDYVSVFKTDEERVVIFFLLFANRSVLVALIVRR